MTDYRKQAVDFLLANDIKMTFKLSDIQTPPTWATEGQPSGLKYSVTMKTSRGAYTFPFWDSVNNRQKQLRPTYYDILACLDIYEGTLDDFVADFGYDDQPVSKVIETYNAVIDQSLQLKHILTAKAVRQLQEIN